MEPKAYQVHVPAPIDDIEHLSETDFESRVLDATEIEGPLSVRRLYGIFAEAAGLSALARNERRGVNRAVTSLRRSREILVASPPEGDEMGPWVVRLPGQLEMSYRETGPRTPEQIPWNELAYHAPGGPGALPAARGHHEAADASEAGPASSAEKPARARASVKKRRVIRVRKPPRSRWSPGTLEVERYRRWSDELAAEFYTSEEAGRPVYLDLEDDVLDEICNKVGDEAPGRAALLDAVRATLPPLDSGDIVFSHHMHSAVTWEAKGSAGAPPFIGLLGAFVVTAEDMCGDSDFAANNYYGRLAKNLGYNHQVADAREHVARDYRNWGAQLWGSLNGWLRDNEGRYGLPTAQAFDHRRYVTLPMSQALLRAHDRQKLPTFFVECDLSPGQQVVADDIEPLLAGWLPNSRMSHGLKKMWASTETARERISDVVAGELEAWDGAVDEVAMQDRDVRLRVSLAVESFPSESARFFTLVGAASSPSGLYGPTHDTAAAVLEVMGEVRGGLQARPSGLDGWLVLDDRGVGSCALVLNGVLTLQCSGRTARRPIGRVVVLERDELNRVFIESDRAHLGVDCAILVHETLWAKKGDAVTRVLRDGWRTLASDAGVPKGWVLILDAQVIGVAADDPDLEPLIPISMVQVSFDNGLKLPGRGGWHVDAPPDIVASCLTEKDFTLEILSDLTDIAATFGPFSGAGLVRAAEWSPDEGDYFVLVKRGATVLAHRTLSLRASDWGADCAGAHGVGTDARDVGTVPLLGATRIGSEPHSSWITGALVWDDGPAVSVDDLPAPFAAGGARCWPASRSDELVVVQFEATQTVDPPACLLTGGHRWRIERVLPGASASAQRATCSQCSRTKIFRPKRSRSKEDNVKRIQERPPVIASLLAADDAAIPFPVILDAIFYAGDGSITMLNGLVSRAFGQGVFSGDLARGLSAIGYVDLVLDQVERRPRAFAVAPPCLVAPPAGDPFLSGGVCRDVSLLARTVAGDYGADLVQSQDSVGIPIWHVVGLEPDRLEAFAEAAMLKLSREPGLRLAQVLPDASGIIGRLPYVRMGSHGLKRFDYSANNWIPAEDSGVPGAYRLNGFGSRYAVLRPGMPEGFAAECDYATAKYLAAPSAGSMVWYDPDEREVICRLGAPLFPLLERALFLDSGRRPERHADGTYRYPGVRPEMARHVQRIVEGAVVGH